MDPATPPEVNPQISLWIGLQDDGWTVWHDESRSYEGMRESFARLEALIKALPVEQRPPVVRVDDRRTFLRLLLQRAEINSTFVPMNPATIQGRPMHWTTP